MIRHISGSIEFDSLGTLRRRIPLFDGSFKTGYVVKEFLIAPDFPTINQELTGKLITDNSEAPIMSWDWGSNIEIGWAAWGTPTSSRANQFDHVRPDNIVIQDLFVEITAVALTGVMNYYISMELQEISEWQGALGLVRNMSQG